MQRVKTIMRVFRGDVRQLPRVIIFTIASIAVYNFSWGFADPFFSIYLSEFSGHYVTIGFFNTLATLAGALVLIPVGNLLDRVRHDKIVNFAKVGYFFVALCYFIAGEFGSTTLLIVTLFFHGGFAAMVWAGTSATLRDYADKKDAGLTFGFYVTARQLAWVIGLGIALLLVLRMPIHYIFIPVMIFPVASILLSRGQPEKHHQPLGSALKDIIFKDKLVGRYIKEMKGFNREMWVTYVLFFFAYSIPLLSLTFLPLYAVAQGYSLVKIGLLVLVMNIPFIFSFISAEIADHSERLRNVIVGFGLSAIAIGLLSILHDDGLWLFALGFVFMAGYSVILPSISSVITILTPKQYTGTGSATLDMTIFISAIIFSPVIGFIVDTFDWGTTFLIAALFFGVLAAATFILKVYFIKQNRVFHLNHPDSKNDPYII
ncbi:MFS transporter [Patescibacteria group bacterium]